MKRGDIFWVNLNPSVGSEIRKQRPCVILSVNAINRVRRTVIVVPLSTAAKEHPPIVIPVFALGRNAVAVCDQLRAVDKTRLIKYAGKILEQDMEKIEDSIKQILVL